MREINKIEIKTKKCQKLQKVVLKFLDFNSYLYGATNLKTTYQLI